MAAKRGSAAAGPQQGQLKVTQTRSTISHIARNRATIRALGLHGIGSSRVVTDNPATRGMVRQVRFLVSVEEVPSDQAVRQAAAQASPGRGGDPTESTSHSNDDAEKA